MLKLNKNRVIIFLGSLVIGLTACGKKQEETVDLSLNDTTTTLETTTTPTTEAEEVKPAETNTNYYKDLINNDAAQKEEAKNKQESDLALADLMLKECTKKLSNCTIDVEATTKYKCGDLDKSLYGDVIVPTNGQYKVLTRLLFEESATQLACKQEKTLYRDTTPVTSFYEILTAQATSIDSWSDKMNFLLTIMAGKNNIPDDLPLQTIKDELSKGEIYRYISKDVRSCLNRFLSIDVESVEEEDNVYVIKGKTKAIFVIVDEIGGNAILNTETMITNNKKNAGLMDTEGILVKHNVDVVLYIDKTTETLKAFEAYSHNNLNAEETELKGIIKDIGTTKIEALNVPEDLATQAVSEISQVNAATIYNR